MTQHVFVHRISKVPLSVAMVFLCLATCLWGQDGKSRVEDVIERLAEEARLLSTQARDCRDGEPGDGCPCTGKVAMKAAKAFSSAAARLQVAAGLPARGKSDLALANAAGALVKTIKYTACGAGVLRDLASDLIEAGQAEVDAVEEEVQEQETSLCDRYEVRVDKLLARCDALESHPPPTGDVGRDQVLRLKALSRELKCRLKARAKAEAYQGKTCGGTCPGDPLHFTRGPEGAPSLEITPVAKGTRVCYTALFDAFVSLEGYLCYVFKSPDSFSLTGSLEACVPRAQCLDVDVRGAISLKTCTDATGFRRVSSVSESTHVHVEGQKPVTSSLKVTANPATIAFVDGLVPLSPAGSITLRAGDQLEERDVLLHLRVKVRGLSDSADVHIESVTHTVAAIEEVRVPAGTFTVARIETVILAKEGPRGKLTSWIAPRVGLVRAVQEDDEGFVELELKLRSYQVP